MYIIIGLIVLAILFFIFLYILFYITFHNSKGRHKRQKFNSSGQYGEYKEKIAEVYSNIISADSERVKAVNRQGMTLFGNYYHNKDNAPVAIMFHGYRSRAMYDNGGGYRIFTERGINVLIPEQRAHSESQGRAITFGIKERYDCIDWIEYTLNRFGRDTEIILVGVSMGAATVLMATELGLPQNVKGIIADCPYSSPEAIIRKVISDMHLPQKLLYPFVRLAGIVYGGFDISSASPLTAVKSAKLPILLIHGEADGFVPHTMSRQIAESCNAQAFFVKGADHGLSYIVDTEGYTKITEEFLNKII